MRRYVLPTLIDPRKPAPLDLGSQPQILIARLSAIGDCILTWPLVTHLKKLLPTSRITWVTDCAASILLEQHPCVDEVIRLRKGFLLRPLQLWSLRNQLHARRFDIAIDPQGLAKSAILSRLSGAKLRLGFHKCQTREGASLFYNMHRHGLAQHLAERQLELLEACNFEMPPMDAQGHFVVDFGWDDSRLDSGKIDVEMRSMGLQNRQFALINPGAGWESKRWQMDRYAVVADRLQAATGLNSLILWGNDQELEFAKTIVTLAPKSCQLAPKTDLLSLAQWSYRAKLFIGSDTGPLHLAAAVGTPCVGMYGTSLPQRCGPYGPQHIAIQKRYDGGSARYRRSTTNAAMRAIEVDDVLQACLKIANRNASVRIAG
jgi:heptosyltransferase I